MIQPEQKPLSVLEKIARAANKFGLYDFLIKPVYNVSQFTSPVTIPFDQDALTGQSITQSSLTIARTSASIGGVTYFHACDHNAVVGSSDTAQVIHEGNNIAFNRLYVWFPDLDVAISKISVNTAFGLNVSAYTSDNYSLVSAQLQIYTLQNNLQGGFQPEIILDKTYSSGLGNLTATGTQMFMVDDEITNWNGDGLFYGGVPVIFNWILTCTLGTGTSQQGIIPLHPYQAVNVPKTMGRSEIKLHANAALTHGDRMLKKQANLMRVDYVGTNIDGKDTKERLEVE